MSPLFRRLLPLFVAKFLLNFVFWYSIEKLFMTSIGFDVALIGVMVAVYSAMSVTMEVPSGILADRWSRKGVMILAALSLAISAAVGSLSYSVPIFLISAVFWGFFDAFASGTAESMIYDTLLETQGHASNYQRVQGWFQTVGGVGLFVSSIIGGLIGAHFGLREVFAVSVVPALVAILALLAFHDTKLQKESQDTHLFTHVKQTFGAVFRNPNLSWILVSLLALAQTNNLIGEMYQTWYLALNTPVTLYGIAGAIILSTYGIGGLATHIITRKRHVVAALGFTVLAAAMLVITHQIWALIAAQFIVGFMTYTLILVLTAQMQVFLPSRYRAGAGSTVNTVGRIIYIGVALLFGWIAQVMSVFGAATILMVFVLVALYSELHSHFSRKAIQ